MNGCLQTTWRGADGRGIRAVDVGDSRLILGTVQRVLADGGGYVNAELIESVGSTVDRDVAMPHWGFASFFFEGWRRCVSNGIVPAWLAT